MTWEYLPPEIAGELQQLRHLFTHRIGGAYENYEERCVCVCVCVCVFVCVCLCVFVFVCVFAHCGDLFHSFTTERKTVIANLQVRECAHCDMMGGYI